MTTATHTTPAAPAPLFIPSDPANFRDLGGIAVNGGTVATATLFRSDDLCLVSADYAAALLGDHGITAVTPTGVQTADGTVHEVDVIIYATGFDAQEFLESIDITGVGGRKLAEQWVDGARAYLGIYVPNFPNLLVTYGPNTNLGGGSIVYMLEAQARHMRQTVDRLEAGSYRSVEVTPEADEAYDRDVQQRLSHSVWAHCDSWYRHASGRITSNWPGSTHPYARRTKVLEPEAFRWS